MAKQTINIGVTANDRKGGPLRTSFGKINSNFTELYDGMPSKVSDLENDSGFITANSIPSQEYTGNIVFEDTTISAPDDTNITIQALDFNSTIRSRLSLSPDSGSVSMRGFSNEDSRTFNTFDWSTANWIASGSAGSLVLVGAATVNDFINNDLNYASNIKFSINGGIPESLESYGYSSGSQTLTINTASAPETDPTAVTEVEFFYTFSSSIGVDYDDGAIRMSARGDMNIRLESDLDVNLIAGDDIRIEGADSFRLINTSNTAPIRVITDDNNNAYTWSFESNGNLINPGDVTIDGGSVVFLGSGSEVGRINNSVSDGSGFQLAAHVDLEIKVSQNDGLGGTEESIWSFEPNGIINFPDSSTQSTAYTGQYSDLSGTPTNVSDFTNDAGYLTAVPSSISVDAMTTNIIKIDDGVQEKWQTLQDATGVVTHDCSAGHIFYHNTPDANFTVNLTNLNLTDRYATNITLIMEQTGFYPNTLQINGSVQVIMWQGNENPSPGNTPGRFDIVTFSILNDTNTYVVFGQLTSF
jgi:hypothetical protein